MSSAAPQQAQPDARQTNAQHTTQLTKPASNGLASEMQGEWVDKRPQAIAQRRRQEIANNSARAMQLKTMAAMMNNTPLQRVEVEESQQAKAVDETVQREVAADTAEAPKPNNTGLPDNLKSGIESLSGMSMDHVKVHYNSAQPAQLNAHAYAQGSEIHVAPGQEQHLPHEAWHVVQQAQGKVKPTMQMKAGVAVNDDVGLESEADLMGAKALGLGAVQMRKERDVGMLELTPSPLVQNMLAIQAKTSAHYSEHSNDIAQLTSETKRKKLDESSSLSDSDESSSVSDSYESSSASDSDDDYIERVPRKGSKKKNPGSEIESSTYKKIANKLSYKTVSGSSHNEEWSQDQNSRTTLSSNLRLQDAQYRNPTHRSANAYHVYNHYGLSKGQSSLNQNVVSHNTPSWGGFQAGGVFENSSFTSPPYNSKIEQKEKAWRTPLESVRKPFKYETKTSYEDVDSDDAESIAGLLTNENWDEDRVRKRLRKVKRIYPDSRRVAGEERKITYSDGKKKTFKQGRDLLAYIPRRAYDENAHNEYLKARGQDSEGSDAELEKTKPKSKKRKRKNSK